MNQYIHPTIIYTMELSIYTRYYLHSRHCPLEGLGSHLGSYRQLCHLGFGRQNAPYSYALQCKSHGLYRNKYDWGLKRTQGLYNIPAKDSSIFFSVRSKNTFLLSARYKKINCTKHETDERSSKGHKNRLSQGLWFNFRLWHWSKAAG